MTTFHTPLLIQGPVKSGKTADLVREANRFRVRGIDIITVKHSMDRRTHDRDGLISSRDGTACKVDIVTDTLCFDAQIGARDKPVVIAIDEGQFFDKSIVEFVEQATLNGHYVIVAALNADFHRIPFTCIAVLAARSKIRTLTAVCQSCGEDALHSKKIGGDRQKTIEVDSADTSYEPRCTHCFLSELSPRVVEPKE